MSEDMTYNAADYSEFHTALGFENKQTAPDYPYGTLRTDMYYYVEYRPKMGWRAVRQSVNPKNGKLNKPHCGTYSDFPIYVGRRADNNHLEFIWFPRFASVGAVQSFINAFWEKMPEHDREYCHAFLALYFKKSPNDFAKSYLTFPDGSMTIKGELAEIPAAPVTA